MKKLLTLCFFAFAMVLGTQTIAAQSTVEINSLASKKTQELKKAVKFSNETEHIVYETYQEYEQKMAKVTKLEAEGKTITSEEKKVIANMVSDKFQKIFSESEFERYEAFLHDHKQ